MDKESLKYLSKDELIEIIISNNATRYTAFSKVIDVVGKKVLDIIEKQEKCDLLTPKGRDKYDKLEKEYQKWEKIQESL